MYLLLQMCWGNLFFQFTQKTGGMQSNAVRDFFCGIISPFVAGSVEQTPVYIMWECASRETMNKTILFFLTKFKDPLIQ